MCERFCLQRLVRWQEWGGVHVLPRRASPSCFLSGLRKWQRKRGIPCSVDWNDVGVCACVSETGCVWSTINKTLFSGCCKWDERCLFHLTLLIALPAFPYQQCQVCPRWTPSLSVYIHMMIYCWSTPTLQKQLCSLLFGSSWSNMLTNHHLGFLHQVGRGEKLWWITKKILGKSCFCPNSYMFIYMYIRGVSIHASIIIFADST